jgi:hypothetical protein
MNRNTAESQEVIRLFVDPLRQAGSRWTRCRTVEEAIEWLKTGKVGILDVASDIEVYGAGGTLSIFHLAFALRDLVANGCIARPLHRVHGSDIHDSFIASRLLAAALGEPTAPQAQGIEAVSNDAPRCLNDLAPAEMARLVRLNAQLREVERWIVERSRDIIAHWRTLPRESDADLEIEPVVSFHLLEDDPRHCEDDDNILAVSHFHGIDTGLRKRGDGALIDCYFDDAALLELDTEVCGVELATMDERLAGVRQSSLFHDLWGHLHLTWDDMLSIGSVWVRIQCEHQRDFTIVP